ncbi:MAG: hypothetical protein F4023_07655 [Acidobacteria bacterium]|nr:hypothetical protein [Acidobacteriota bacterium]MYA47497.1 hypothetical protein [Acidobacteriota bacterium]MYH21954.1 hypothetical protein [Acidobacteriota bacterium]MYI39771.1 hypothetical protein [Acidobacteriota bacterium]MYK79510.1 hypothetical protein [Acidobacteriota bacterium]
MKGWRDRLAGRRADSLPIELPPHRDQEGWRRPVDGEPRLVAPPAPRTPLPRLAARIAVGSVGLALAAGVIVGRMTAVETSSAAPEGGPAELRIRGAGHLHRFAGPGVLDPGGLLADAAVIREQLLATGIPERVSVERLLPGGVLVDVEEKRAVALLDWEPPAALADDGTVLGPATAADFAWADAADLVLIRGADRSRADFAERAALAGRLAAALSRRPNLDRLVSEMDVSGGPYRVQVILRSPAVPVLLSERSFVEGLARVAALLPDLVERWPGLSRVDARVPDRFLVRSEPVPDPEELPDQPAGGETE